MTGGTTITVNSPGTQGRGHGILRPVRRGPGAFSDNWPVLRVMLEGTCFKLTRSHILDEWSSDFPKPHPGTLARWLDRAVECGLVKRQGAGRKSDPFYYWLPEREDKLYGGMVWL